MDRCSGDADAEGRLLGGELKENAPAQIHGALSKEREDVVRETIDAFVSLARDPEIDGIRRVPHSYSQGASYVEVQAGDVQSVVYRLSEAGGDTVYLEYESLRFRVGRSRLRSRGS